MGFIGLFPFPEQVTFYLLDLVTLEDSVGYNIIMRKADISGDIGNLLSVGGTVP
jgi:hypothetical protein